MADEDTPAEDTPAEDTPVEDTPVEDSAAEDTPVQDIAAEDSPVEDAPAEDSPVEDAPAEDTGPGEHSDEADVEDDAAAADAQPDGSVTGSKLPRRGARVAALVTGAVLASAAVIAGVVWAITAIVDDDDYHDCCAVDYATPYYPEERWGPDFDARHPADRDWRDWNKQSERRRGERRDRDWNKQSERRRGERRDRDWGEQAERDKGGREERGRKEKGTEKGAEKHSEKADGSETSKADGAEDCMTVLRFGTGDDAVAVLICNAPRAEWPQFESDRDRDDSRDHFRDHFRHDSRDHFRDHFDFGKRPRDFFRFSPFFPLFRDGSPFFDGRGDGPPFDREGRPFGDGPPFDFGEFFGEGRPFEESFGDGPPFDFGEFFGEGRPFEESFGDGVPFDFGEFFGDGVPFDLREFEGELGDLFREGDRGFQFRSDGTQDGFCFQLGEEQEECIAGLDQLSDDEREQLEQMLEMLDDFGLGGFFDGLQGFLEELEPGFPESSTEPSGVSGA